MTTDPNDSGRRAHMMAPLVNHDAVRADLAAIADTGRPVDYRDALLAVVLHVPALLAEGERLRLLALAARREYANLRAAARAALAAEVDGEAEPLGYLTDELPAVDLTEPSRRREDIEYLPDDRHRLLRRRGHPPRRPQPRHGHPATA